MDRRRDKSPPQMPMTIDEQIRAIIQDEIAKQMQAVANELVTVREYARRLSISMSTVRQAVAERRLAVTRIGRAVRIAPDATIANRAPTSANERFEMQGDGRTSSASQETLRSIKSANRAGRSVTHLQVALS